MAKKRYLCTMILEKLSLINYKNITEATLELSPKINCFIGQNGVGKTNVLDAIYYLSFCHSAQTTQDSLVIRHDQDFFMLEGEYQTSDLRSSSARLLPEGRKNGLHDFRTFSSLVLGTVPGANSTAASVLLVL